MYRRYMNEQGEAPADVYLIYLLSAVPVSILADLADLIYSTALSRIYPSIYPCIYRYV